MADEPRYRKQEQEPASPEVTELAPGILRCMLPVELPGLGHVNCYALEDERGFTLVDPGLPSPESWTALQDRLAQAGAGLRHVHTVVVTHSHFDHFGAATRIRDETGADILTHELFRTLWQQQELDEALELEPIRLGADADEAEEERMVERLRERWRTRRTPWGREGTPPPDDHLRRMIRERGGAMFRTPEPTVTVVDDQVVHLAGREWVAIHTPGHTQDHLCLLDPVEGVLLSGDHVLPTITPHIGGMTEQPDPLARFFDSLGRMEELDGVRLALPAHGHPFTDLAGRAAEIRQHHLERLDILRHAGDELGVAPVETFMERLFRERSWGEMAASETWAHLEHLRVLGDAEAVEVDGVKRYRVG
jgi:glyoxylase-like metal-dependent hydrolase (beta-lactamase superfamily II)